MHLSPFVLLFLLSSLSNCGLAVKVQQLQQQCDCNPNGPVFGVTCPALSIYNEDGCTIDSAKIKLFAKYLQDAGVNAVAINSPNAGGDNDNVAAKMETINAWCAVKKATGFPYVLTCQVGECNLNDTIRLTQYVKKSCCDVVVIGPPSIPVPTIDDLADYVKLIAKYAYPKKFLYADPLIPECGFVYNSAKLSCILADTVENYYGIRTYDADACLKVLGTCKYTGIALLSESSTDVMAPYAYCLNGTTTLSTNFAPEVVVAIQQATLKGKIETAAAQMKDFNCFWLDALNAANMPERLDRSYTSYEQAVVKVLVKIVAGLDLGMNYVNQQLSREAILRIYKVCENYGYAKRYPYDDVDNYIAKTKRPKSKYTSKSYDHHNAKYNDDED